MNEAFSKSLSDVLTHVSDKLIAHVREDTNAAFESNKETMLGIVQTMQITSDGLTDSVKDFTKNLDGEFKKSKSKLDNYVARFNKTMDNMFNMDTKEKRLFYLGIFGGIATPAILLLIQLAQAVDYLASRFGG